MKDVETTVPFTSTATGQLPATRVMVTVSAIGEVAIDWNLVAEAAAGDDRHARAFPQTLLAVRDGTYKLLSADEALK